MTALKTNLVIEQGADWGHGWTVTYNGTPIDATWTAHSQIRAYAASTEVLAELGVSVDGSGNVVIGIGAAESAAWSFGKGVYDVEVTNADESVTLRVAQGNVTVSAEVTRE